jgi:hypothetical protein
MKKLLICTFAIFISVGLMAQKQKQKNNKSDNPKQASRDIVLGSEKKKSNDKPAKDVDAIWDGTKDRDGGGPKYSKNQPAKVRAAFASDYPNANNVNWSKYRGDWTATFNNGITRSVAVYHANGDRRDTRTIIPKTQLPKIILDDIFKKRRNAQLGDVIKIEVPQSVKDIFRIKTTEGNTTHFVFYDADGKEVSYDY